MEPQNLPLETIHEEDRTIAQHLYTLVGTDLSIVFWNKEITLTEWDRSEKDKLLCFEDFEDS